MEYKHLGFPLKIMLGYLVGILILALLFSASIAHLGTVINDYNNTVKIAWRQLNALQTLQASGLQIRLDIDNDTAKVDMDLRLIDYWFASFLQASRDGVPRDFILLVREFYTFREQTLKLINLKEQKASKSDLATQHRNFSKDYNIFMARIKVEIERGRSNVEVSEVRFLQRVNQLLLLNILLAPLSFLFLYIYGYFLSNYTGIRLRRFLENMRKILAGNYKEKIEDDSKDEIGQIAEGINELAERLDTK
ncbi:hypothetical protein AMJ44_12105 [candidate division WOR-1 bacterium DG_54_3]|uniref:HAMP domain-containing protein n=1 Tax=candidate division WOR-1 bacterium DG_54_3 TaxID=1703775 RepID=A0A0S7XRD1_UNCSA|nr:MAG: hypothetical protein AMJ44_12105 [candidate division WOR-1 bacterium DG_54_3]